MLRLHHASLLVVTLVGLLGCGSARRTAARVVVDEAEESSNAPIPVGLPVFDANQTADVEGVLLWDGPVPVVPPFVIGREPQTGAPIPGKQSWGNPNAPQIEPQARGVGNAVVYLLGIDPAKSKPWDHVPLRVEQRGKQLQLVQGETPVTHGLLQRGDWLELVSRDQGHHALHASGASYFSLAFPEPDQVRRRRLDHTGVVEISSGAGWFWERAYVLVMDHPYCCRTEADGSFNLTGVPPGNYELVWWLPNWKELNHDRDSENGTIWRLRYQPPVERKVLVTVEPGQNLYYVYSISTGDFPPD